MESKIVMVQTEKLPLLHKHYCAKTHTFEEYGIQWPVGYDFLKIKDRAIELGWKGEGYIICVVTNEKKWLLTKLKYGI